MIARGREVDVTFTQARDQDGRPTVRMRGPADSRAMLQPEVAQHADSILEAIRADRDGATAAESSPTRTASAQPTATVVRLADVPAKEVDWLWPSRLPAGMVVLLDGAPGTGKSTFVTDIAARMTTGRPFPNEAGGARPPCDVVMIGHEDSPEHTLRPRLDAAGADVARIHLLTGVGGRLPSLPEDGAAIERVVRDQQARLLVIDPISAYIGTADLHRDNEMRSALAPLAAIAERTGATVLLLRHLRKSGGTDAIYRGLGSVAITALARTALMLLNDPDDPNARILAWSKMSVAPVPKSLKWRWADGDGAPRIVWEGTSDLSANDILAREDRGRGGDDGAPSAVDGAADWLMGQLEGTGSVPVKDLQARAAEDGVAWRAVERAKGRLKLGLRRQSAGNRGAGQWVWVAPGVSAEGAPDPRKGRKAAKHTSLAALRDTAGVDGANRAEPGDFSQDRKTANPASDVEALAALPPPATAGGEVQVGHQGNGGPATNGGPPAAGGWEP